MPKVKYLTRLCEAMPESYEGYLDDASTIYARIRFGYGRIDIDNIIAVEVFDHLDHYRGSFNEGELQEMFEAAGIEWDGSYKVN